jgi:hypothetical protein
LLKGTLAAKWQDPQSLISRGALFAQRDQMHVAKVDRDHALGLVDSKSNVMGASQKLDSSRIDIWENAELTYLLYATAKPGPFEYWHTKARLQEGKWGELAEFQGWPEYYDLDFE